MATEQDVAAYKKSKAAIKVAGDKPGEDRVEWINVPIYRSGKVPTYIDKEDLEKEDSDDDQLVQSITKLHRSHLLSTGERGKLSIADIPDITEKKQRRKRRVAEAEVVKKKKKEASESDGEGAKEEEAPAPVVQKELKVEMPEEDDDEESDDEAARRRERLRQKAKEHKAEQEEELLGGQEDEEEEEDDSSEWETDSGDSDFEAAPMMKPVFVPKGKRDTFADRKKVEEEQAKVEKGKARRLKMRQDETKQWVREEVIRDNQLEENKEASEDEDSSDIDEEEEYEKWKLRELGRIKRDKEEKDKILQAQAETERRRNMTDQQIIEEDRDNPHKKSSQSSKMNFLQKYYHPGVFYQDIETEKNVLKRDFNQPVGLDRMDKTILPAVMQVKNFGRSGRTKWTHLTNEDTSKVDESPWQEANALRSKYDQKMAGTGDFARPARRKKQRLV